MVASIKHVTPDYVDFSDISTQHLLTQFELKRARKNSFLEEWLNMTCDISPETKQELNVLRDKLDMYGSYYNEGELKWKFLNPLIDLIDYEEEQYDTFINRTIQATIEGEKLGGSVDFILAKRDTEIIVPFFFNSEYNKEKGTKDDVIGQLLSAMLVPQQLNKNDQPIYGCYVIGRFWFFVVLTGKEYAISSGHVASNDDLFSIYRILVNMKKIIKEKLLAG